MSNRNGIFRPTTIELILTNERKKSPLLLACQFSVALVVIIIAVIAGEGG